MDDLPYRVLQAIGGTDVVARLVSLSGSDFTTLMLAVARERAASETPASLLRRYRGDRFVQPAATGWQLIRAAEDTMAAQLPPGTELLALPPLVPFGSHSVLGPMSQDKVVTTIRASEVAADPTNALALESAVRRRAAEFRGTVRLAAFQRVVRAQRPHPGYLAHFSLLGLVTAGRDEGGHRFELTAIVEQVRSLVIGLAATGLGPAQLAVTPLSPVGAAIAAALPAELTDAPVEVVLDLGRQAGRGYYRDLCFKINVAAGGTAVAAGGTGLVGGGTGLVGGGTGATEVAAGATELAEVGDGGFTDWTARLTASVKERLLISGVGIDRVVALRPDRRP